MNIIPNEKESVREQVDIRLLKDVIMKNLNHQFRTPMTSILGFSELLLESITDSDHTEIVQKIHEAATRLHHTLNQLMVLSELHSDIKDIVAKTFNVNELCESITHRYQNQAGLLNIKLVCYSDTQVFCKANILLFSHVIENLLDNVLKYTVPGVIIISVKLIADKKRKYAQVEIHDTRTDIPAIYQTQIIEELSLVNEEDTQKFKGISLGLGIDKKLVQLMKGDLTFKYVPEKGSAFYLKLPYAKQTISGDELNVVKPAVIEPGIRKKFNRHKGALPRLLLVEDNLINVELIMLYLKNICQITHSFDGISAINLSRENQFDIILMDINLGLGINGIDTLLSIKKIPGYDEIPVIAITGYTNPADIEILHSQGFNAYLAKPFNKSSLYELMRETLFID